MTSIGHKGNYGSSDTSKDSYLTLTLTFVSLICCSACKDDDGFNLIQPSLIQQLRTILDQYPDDGQILKVKLIHYFHLQCRQSNLLPFISYEKGFQISFRLPNNTTHSTLNYHGSIKYWITTSTSHS